MGGAVAAIERGFVQKEIEERAYCIQKEIEQGERIVVGMNEYKVEEDVDIALFKPSPEHARSQIDKLQMLKKIRDQARVQSALEAVRKAAQDEENLMPRFIEAVKAYVTLGEICDILREVFGEYRQAQTIG